MLGRLYRKRNTRSGRKRSRGGRTDRGTGRKADRGEIKQRQQLLGVLEDVAYEFGVVTDNSSFSDSRYGLAHADLIDINQDGQDELYMLFRGSRHHESVFDHRNQDGYIVEIWQANKEAEQAVLLHHDFINLDSLAPTDMSISFVTTGKGKYC